MTPVRVRRPHITNVESDISIDTLLRVQSAFDSAREPRPFESAESVFFDVQSEQSTTCFRLSIRRKQPAPPRRPTAQASAPPCAKYRVPCSPGNFRPEVSVPHTLRSQQAYRAPPSQKDFNNTNTGLISEKRIANVASITAHPETFPSPKVAEPFIASRPPSFSVGLPSLVASKKAPKPGSSRQAAHAQYFEPPLAVTEE